MSPGRVAAASALVALGLGGCAAPPARVGAQWVDPSFVGQSLQGAPVLVVCESQDMVLKLQCEAEASSRILALGALPRTDATLVNPTPGREPPAGQYLDAARAAGVRAVFNATLTPDFSQPVAVPTFSIGIGGFSGGSSRGGVGGGVGVTLPAGGVAPAAMGIAATASLVDVSTGRVIWTARASAPPGNAVSAQVTDVLGPLSDSLAQAGVF